MRLIDADALVDALMMHTWYDEDDWVIDDDEPKREYIKGWLPDISTVSGWISVKDRLPENAKHPGDFCPRYLVYTDYGITEGWYNPDKGCWYGFLTFMTDEFELWNIDLERGDIPKRVKNIPVKYWMPMPEPPKEDNDAEQ